MARRVFNAVSLVSAILLGCTVLLWAGAFVLNPWDHHVSLTRDFHMGVWGGLDGPPLGRMVFFNDDEYGPYRGSIVALVDDQGNPPRTLTFVRWGDAYGIYYRYIHWSDSNATCWTLMVSFAYPMILFGILPALWLWLRWRRIRSLRAPAKGDASNSQQR